MNIEIGDSVKIVNAIDPIKMVVIDKIDNDHLTQCTGVIPKEHILQ